MKVCELIYKLMEIEEKYGNIPIKILTSMEDEEGEDRNIEWEIEDVDMMFEEYAYISPEW